MKFRKSGMRVEVARKSYVPRYPRLICSQVRYGLCKSPRFVLGSFRGLET